MHFYNSVILRVGYKSGTVWERCHLIFLNKSIPTFYAKKTVPVYTVFFRF